MGQNWDLVAGNGLRPKTHNIRSKHKFGDKLAGSNVLTVCSPGEDTHLNIWGQPASWPPSRSYARLMASVGHFGHKGEVPCTVNNSGCTSPIAKFGTSIERY